MSADNYYYIMHHPNGGFTTIMRWMSDDKPVRKVAPEDPRFLDFEKAYAYGATRYSEYGVRTSAEVLAEINGTAREFHDDGAEAFANEFMGARAECVAMLKADSEFAEALRHVMDEYVSKMK